ncbi:MAG: roadblock/LC7 domain-containing protein [Methanocellales archaeon]|nr:roadblock/LC7 domain-containing protein [Methanocellales archaeon]
MSATMETFEDALADLKAMKGIRASAIITRDGLLVTGNVPPEMHVESFAAMAATMSSAAEVSMSELGQGIPKHVIAKSDDARIITMGAGLKTLLVVIADPATKLDPIIGKMKEAADKIKKAASVT